MGNANIVQLCKDTTTMHILLNQNVIALGLFLLQNNDLYESLFLLRQFKQGPKSVDFNRLPVNLTIYENKCASLVKI